MLRPTAVGAHRPLLVLVGHVKDCERLPKALQRLNVSGVAPVLHEGDMPN